MSCVVFDNTTTNVADNTVWYNAGSLAAVPGTMITNTRDGDAVTSVLTIENISLNDNGTGYLCGPALFIKSYVGVISIRGGEYVYYVQNIEYR